MKKFMTTKTLLVFLLSLVLAFSLTACGGGDDGGDDATSTAASSQSADDGSSADSTDTSADPSTDPDVPEGGASASAGGTLEELYANDDPVMTAFVNGVSQAGDNISCRVEGNTIFVSMPLDTGGLDVETLKPELDSYFEDEEMRSQLEEQLGIIANSAGVSDVTLTYEYTDNAGKTFYTYTYDFQY